MIKAIRRFFKAEGRVTELTAESGLLSSYAIHQQPLKGNSWLAKRLRRNAKALEKQRKEWKRSKVAHLSTRRKQG